MHKNCFPNLIRRRPIPPVLREYISYDPETGEFKSIKHRRNAPVGKTLGCLNKGGYLVVAYKQVYYRANRVAWFLMTGEDPGDADVDHENGDKSDNRWVNLRLLSHKLNSFNGGQLGYKRHSTSNKLSVQINVNGKCIHLGLEECPLLARIRFLDAAEEYYPGVITSFLPRKVIVGRRDYQQNT